MAPVCVWDLPRNHRFFWCRLLLGWFRKAIYTQFCISYEHIMELDKVIVTMEGICSWPCELNGCNKFGGMVLCLKRLYLLLCKIYYNIREDFKVIRYVNSYRFPLPGSPKRWLKNCILNSEHLLVSMVCCNCWFSLVWSSLPNGLSLGNALNPHRLCTHSSNGYQVERKLGTVWMASAAENAWNMALWYILKLY